MSLAKARCATTIAVRVVESTVSRSAAALRCVGTNPVPDVPATAGAEGNYPVKSVNLSIIRGAMAAHDVGLLAPFAPTFGHAVIRALCVCKAVVSAVNELLVAALPLRLFLDVPKVASASVAHWVSRFAKIRDSKVIAGHRRCARGRARVAAGGAWGYGKRRAGTGRAIGICQTSDVLACATRALVHREACARGAARLVGEGVGAIACVEDISTCGDVSKPKIFRCSLEGVRFSIDAGWGLQGRCSELGLAVGPRWNWHGGDFREGEGAQRHPDGSHELQVHALYKPKVGRNGHQSARRAQSLRRVVL